MIVRKRIDLGSLHQRDCIVGFSVDLESAHPERH
jgi:hypothetical protein